MMTEEVISISEIIDAVKKRWKIIAATTLTIFILQNPYPFVMYS